METLQSKRSLRGMSIPVINDSAIIKQENDEFIDIFFGTKEKDKYEECLQKVMDEAAKTNTTPVYHFDFIRSTQLGERHWFVQQVGNSGLNVYINSDCKKETSLVNSEKDTGYEAAFWYTGKKQ